MRHFIYFSQKARTSGNWPDNNLMKAGRMDIVCNVIIQALFLSNEMRGDVHLHLIFNGAPNPPMHLEFVSGEMNKDIISKKDIGGLIKRMLYKCVKGRKNEVFPGCFIEKKSFPRLLEELENKSKRIFVLDSKGQNIRNVDSDELNNSVFVIGDHEGLPKKEVKRFDKVSIGYRIYFASQVFIIVNNVLDIKQES